MKQIFDAYGFDVGRLKDDLDDFNQSEYDCVLIDIADGCYTYDFSFGLKDLEYIRENTTKQILLNLRVKDPYNVIDIFIKKLLPGDMVCIYSDSEYQPDLTIEKIINAKMIPCLGISEKNSVVQAEELLNLVDYVLMHSPHNQDDSMIRYKVDEIRKTLNKDICIIVRSNVNVDMLIMV